MSYGERGSSGTIESSAISARDAGSDESRRGGSSRLFDGRNRSSAFASSIAVASSGAARCATPLMVVCVVAPPRNAASTSSCVTAFTTLGPVTNM